MGILVNEGRKNPTVRIRLLHFAEGTPFETLVAHQEPDQEQVLNPLVAQILCQKLLEVVEQGTVIGAKGALAPTKGINISIGGKTGIGDHRKKV